MASSNNPDIRALERTLGMLLNKQLQNICALHGLRTSGVKAELQNRIKNALIENYHSDPINYRQIRNTIENIRGGHSSQANMASPSTSGGQVQGQSSRNNYYHYNASGSNVSHQANGYRSEGAGAGYRGVAQPSSDLHFKPSPFYTFESRIGGIHTCDVMSQHRNSITIQLKVSDHTDLSRCTYDTSMQIMMFCAADNQGPQDISFPHQSEIKVNGGEIRANLRGLKGKPGTTRPVNITNHLRLKQYNYNNNIEFTYALTNKVKKSDPSHRAQKYYLALYLCRTVEIDDLVTRIKGKKIAKTSVVRELSKAANDPDVVATSQVLSLKCPLSFMRLSVPCRSVLCKHIQCFDASSYLQLQQQGPQWVCPVCNKPAPFENLAADEYVGNILENTSDSVEQVTIEPDGQWRIQAAESSPKRPRHSEVSAKIEDDDLAIVSDSRSFGNGVAGGPRISTNPYSTPNRSLFSSGTPDGQSREPSNAPRSGSNKRPAEVIDLTLSSDEDDEPIVRAPKRQYQGPSPGLSLPLPPSYNY
ncbi:PINIT domain-containing protein [Whalleya microplaca]|nr:PINIT domain-containing protein [Whalleya microplaca]